jgi:hypothetical protein
MDNYLNKNIKITKKDSNIKSRSFIKSRPFSTYNSINKINIDDKIIDKERISTIDIETIDFNNIQTPVAISLAYLNDNFEINTKLFLVNHQLLIKDKDKAINEL